MCGWRTQIPWDCDNQLGLQLQHPSTLPWISGDFFANGQKLMAHVLAYLLFVLFREANAKTPEVKTMEVGTARSRLFKVGAVVKATHRRIWFHVASHWPGRDLLIAATDAVSQYIRDLHEIWKGMNLFIQSSVGDPRERHKIVFTPLTLK